MNNLLFKRGNTSMLNNIDLTENMMFFTTDTNCIYLDAKNQNNQLTRYKMFGITDDDIVNNLNDASENSFLSDDNTLLLQNSQIATNGNTTNKFAVGNGYYNNVIGNNIQNVLYLNKPTITSTIQYLQQNARSRLTELWSNSNPSGTWSDLDGTESFNITLSQTYLGYVMLVRAFVDNNSVVYPIIFFNLPTSITNNFNNSYGRDLTLNETYDTDSINMKLSCNIMVNNPKQIQVVKEQHSQEGMMALGKFLVPIKLYGWSL